MTRVKDTRNPILRLRVFHDDETKTLGQLRKSIYLCWRPFSRKVFTWYYLMLFAALTNAVCLYNASFLPLISANAFYFHALSLFISFFYLHHTQCF